MQEEQDRGLETRYDLGGSRCPSICRAIRQVVQEIALGLLIKVLSRSILALSPAKWYPQQATSK